MKKLLIALFVLTTALGFESAHAGSKAGWFAGGALTGLVASEAFRRPKKVVYVEEAPSSHRERKLQRELYRAEREIERLENKLDR